MDVRLLDYSPPGFRLSALGDRVLLERMPHISTTLRRAAAQELADIREKARRAGSAAREG